MSGYTCTSILLQSLPAHPSLSHCLSLSFFFLSSSILCPLFCLVYCVLPHTASFKVNVDSVYPFCIPSCLLYNMTDVNVVPRTSRSSEVDHCVALHKSQ